MVTVRGERQVLCESGMVRLPLLLSSVRCWVLEHLSKRFRLLGLLGGGERFWAPGRARQPL